MYNISLQSVGIQYGYYYVRLHVRLHNPFCLNKGNTLFKIKMTYIVNKSCSMCPFFNRSLCPQKGLCTALELRHVFLVSRETEGEPASQKMSWNVGNQNLFRITLYLKHFSWKILYFVTLFLCFISYRDYSSTASIRKCVRFLPVPFQNASCKEVLFRAAVHNLWVLNK